MIPTKKRRRYRFTKIVHVMRDVSRGVDYEVDPIQPVTVHTAYADIRPWRGTEQEQANQMVGTADVVISMRHTRREILVTDWVEVNGKQYNILRIEDEDGEAKVLRFHCRTRDVGTGATTWR